MRFGWGVVAMVALAGCSRCKSDKSGSSTSGSSGSAGAVGTVTVGPITASVAGPTAPIAFAPDALGSISVKVTLTNSSPSPITVSKFTDGNITVTSLSCDSGDPTLDEGLVLAFAPPRAYAASALRELASRASFVLELPGLRTLHQANGQVTQRSYVMAKPGRCTVRLRYHYQGLDAGKRSVMHEVIDLPPFDVVVR